MNLREVVRDLRWERRRLLAMSRLADPVFAKDYLRKARNFGIAAEIVERVGNQHRRKEKK